MINYKICAEVNGNTNTIDKSDGLISAKLKIGLTKTESLILTFTKDTQALEYLFEPGCIVTVAANNQMFAGRVITQAKDFYLTNTIECEGLRAYLLDSILRPYDFSGSPDNYFKQLINSHNSQVEQYKQFEIAYFDVVDTDNNNYITRANSNYPNTFDELTDKFCNNLGSYLETTRTDGINYISCYQASNLHQNKQKVVFGDNILDLTSKKDFGDIKTAIIPIGKDGLTIEHMLTESQPSDWGTKWQDYCTKSGDTYTRLTSSSAPTWEANKYYYYLDYVYDSTAVAKYGLIYDTLTLDDVTTTKALKRKAEVHVESLCNPLNNVTVKAIDLAGIDDSTEPFWVGYCDVDSPAHGITDQQMLITEMDIDLLNAANNTLTFGSEIKSLTYSTSNDSVEIGKKVEQIKEQRFDAIENATDLISGNKGGHVLIDKDEDGKPIQILIMDNENKDNAKHVIRLNKNGIGFSTTGYNGPFANAWTIDGNLVADFITSGVLESVLIRSNDAEYTSSTTDGVTTYEVTEGMVIDLLKKCFATPKFNINSNGDTLYKGLLRYKNSTEGTAEETMRWEYDDFENNNHGSIYAQAYNSNPIPNHPNPLYLLRLILEAPRLLLKTYDEDDNEECYFEIIGNGKTLETNIERFRALGSKGFNVVEEIRTGSHFYQGNRQVAPIHFAKVSKTVTVPANGFVCADFGSVKNYCPEYTDIVPHQSYEYMGCMVDNGGWSDQWLISASKYGANIMAMIHSKHGDSLTNTVTLTIVYCFANLVGNPGTDYIPCLSTHSI